jgi:hypothetical protein
METARETDIVTVSLNGAVVRENFVTDISYTVNPDCSGTYTVPDASFGIHRAQWCGADRHRDDLGLRTGAGSEQTGVTQVEQRR